MKITFLILLLTIMAPSWGQDDTQTDNSTDYKALTGSLLYLNKVWVDEPAQRQNNIDAARAASPQAPLQRRVPTCFQTPVYAADGSLLSYNTQCY